MIAAATPPKPVAPEVKKIKPERAVEVQAEIMVTDGRE
jgi:hypothetical protein